jgi:hypothetical protein
MSLVHEALQKAGREKLRKTGVQPAPALKPAPRPAPPFGPAESRPVETVATMPVASHAVSVASTFASGQSVDQAAAVYPQKKQSALLPVLIVCVSLVAIVAIVFLVSLAAPMIRESRQTVHAGGETQPPTAATEPKPNEPAPQPVVASPAHGFGASEPVRVSAQQRPAPPAGSAEDGFRLTGIMILPDSRYAVLNGHAVYESSYVDGATVKKIERDRVTLVDAQGKEIVLRLN